LKFSLGPDALSLATSDGNIHKSVKSTLETKIDSITDVPQRDLRGLCDGMCLIQQIPNGLVILPRFI